MMENTDGSGNDWEYSTDSAISCVYVNQFAFKSTTASNGYMLFFGNKYNADVACANALGDTPWDAFFQTSALDLSGESSVILKFQHAYRWCCQLTSRLAVEVSNDSTSWTEFPVSDVGVNASSPNPVLAQVNISAVAAGQSKVWIRFHLINTAHYYWTVDDVALTQGAANDVQLSNTAADFNYTYGGYYSQMPLRQASTSSIAFRGEVFNNGSATQTNVTLDVDIQKSGSSVYSQTSPGISLDPNVTDTLEITNAFSPGATAADTGEYTINYTVQQTESEENPGDNSSSSTFMVTDTVFARDNGVLNNAFGPDNYLCCVADGSEVGLIFEFSADDLARSITFYVANTTNIRSGLSIFANLYKISASGDFSSSPVAQSDLRDIDSTDLGKWITVPFATPGDVMMDSTYVASIAVFGLDNGSFLRLGDDLTTNQPDPNIAPTTFISTGTTWYWITNSPLLRLNTTTTVGTDEISKKYNLTYYPNPTNDQVHLFATNLGNQKVTISVMDLLGNQLFSKEVTTQNGTVSEDISLANQAEGIYLMRMQGQDWEKTMKVTKVR